MVLLGYGGDDVTFGRILFYVGGYVVFCNVYDRVVGSVNKC